MSVTDCALVPFTNTTLLRNRRFVQKEAATLVTFIKKKKMNFQKIHSLAIMVQLMQYATKCTESNVCGIEVVKVILPLVLFHTQYAWSLLVMYRRV